MDVSRASLAGCHVANVRVSVAQTAGERKLAGRPGVDCVVNELTFGCMSWSLGVSQEAGTGLELVFGRQPLDGLSG